MFARCPRQSIEGTTKSLQSIVCTWVLGSPWDIRGSSNIFLCIGRKRSRFFVVGLDSKMEELLKVRSLTRVVRN